MKAENFDPFMFHDNLVHGIAVCVEGFKSELRLDLDYIISWPTCVPEDPDVGDFSVVKGLLTFQDVTDLNVTIDWGSTGYTTAVSGPYIDVIQRNEIAPALRLPEYFTWKIIFSDGRSSISFGASSISLQTFGDPIKVGRQYLTEQERSR